MRHCCNDMGAAAARGHQSAQGTHPQQPRTLSADVSAVQLLAAKAEGLTVRRLAGRLAGDAVVCASLAGPCDASPSPSGRWPAVRLAPSPPAVSGPAEVS